MKPGGHGKRHAIEVINNTHHALSPSDETAFKEKAFEESRLVDTVIINETEHRGVEYHALELKFLTRTTKIPYCKAAGGNFGTVLEELKNCKREK